MYLSFYGLKEEPFRLTPDPRFIHLAQPHRNALLQLVEGIVTRKGVMVAVGPIGTGKTTVLHAMQHILEYKLGSQKRLASAFILNPTLSRDELLEAILDEFEVACDSTSKPKRLLALHELLSSTHDNGGVSMLVVDEAHLLSPDLIEEIRLLTNMDSYGGKLLQVVLCGQPELATLLLKPELKAMRQRIAVVAQLRALNSTEARMYVMERMSAAGLKGPCPFTDAFFESMYRLTDGVPRVINLVCDKALANGFRHREKRIGPNLIEQVLSDSAIENTAGVDAQLENVLRQSEQDDAASVAEPELLTINHSNLGAK